MTCSRACSALVVLWTLFVCPSAAHAKWTRVTSPHFVFVGDASEREIRNIAQRLELFRETLGRLFSSQATGPPVPTVVIVFQNEKSLQPFTPRYNGRAVSVAGYFTGADETNYIAVNAEQDSAAYGVIFHEYAHFLLRNAFGTVPLWANEGLAEFYQTFEPRDQGQGAMLGIPSGDNLQLLLQTLSLLPIPELIGVAHDSPMYNEGTRRSVFYAQSWALVHYLVLGSPERAGQLQTYLNLVRQGTSGTEAFTEAFGSDTDGLGRELRQYMQRKQFNALRLTFNEKLTAVETSPHEVIGDAEAAGYLGALLMAINRPDDARAFLQKTIDRQPTAARATAALGVLEFRQSHDDLAFGLLEKAISLDPNLAAAHRAYGRLLMRRADRGGSDEDALMRRASDAFARALELEPQNTTTAAALAAVTMLLDEGASDAVNTMRKVVAAVPGREDYQLLLAQALLRQQDFDGARAVLGPLIARPAQPEIASAARRLMSFIAEVRNRQLRSGGAAGSTPDVPSVASASGDRRPTAEDGKFSPALRVVGAGETRVLGVFASVECRPGAVILLIDTASGPVRMAVPRFEEVDFVSYRADSPAGISCGVQRPSYRVFATFRTDAPPMAGADTANRAVAIELLPDGDIPR